jgi:hypothetical protein
MKLFALFFYSSLMHPFHSYQTPTYPDQYPYISLPLHSAEEGEANVAPTLIFMNSIVIHENANISETSIRTAVFICL